MCGYIYTFSVIPLQYNAIITMCEYTNFLLQTPPCHELSLGPSSLSHKASLVTVIPHAADGGATAACLAVSPEGAVRYWANVAHESSFVEISSELKGEECTAVALMQVKKQLLVFGINYWFMFLRIV